MSVLIIASAVVAFALVIFWSPIAILMGSNFTAKLPPKPQQVSTSFISTNSKPCTCCNSNLGSCLILHSRKAAQLSW